MSYTPTVWAGKVTTLGPTNLNHLENGLQAAAAVADAALPTPAGTNGQFLQRVGGLWVPHTLVAADIPAVAGAELDIVSVTTSQTSTQTVQASATTIITSSAVVFDGATKIVIEFWCGSVYHSVAGSTVVLDLWDGATDLCFIRAISPQASQGTAASLKRELTPSAATHTYTVRMWAVGAGTSHADAGTGLTANESPMFLRISKAA